LGRGRAGQFGWLKVSVSPWARVTVDGQDQGQTPISALKLSVGKHRVVLQNEELGRKETVVTIIEAAKTERIGREWTVGP